MTKEQMFEQLLENSARGRKEIRKATRIHLTITSSFHLVVAIALLAWGVNVLAPAMAKLSADDKLYMLSIFAGSILLFWLNGQAVGRIEEARRSFDNVNDIVIKHAERAAKG